MSLYEEIVAAGIAWDSHESDLYILVCPESTAILERNPVMSKVTRTFTDQKGRKWYDVPFAYTPWWEARCPKCGGASPNCS